MISRVEIRNFRCFKSFVVQGLKRINLIVGESGSGKTALLETLFLASCGNPEAFFRLRRWRGFAEKSVETILNRDSFESLFQYLFHNGQKDLLASIRFIDSTEGRRQLDIYFEREQTLHVSLAKTESSVNITPLTFKWDVHDIVSTITLEVKDGQIAGKGNAETFPLNFIAPRNSSTRFDAQAFSSLSRSRRLSEIIEVIQQSFEFVEDLSLELLGGEALIHAQIPGFSEKVPVNELSGGLNRYLTIALAIATNPNGVVLVDEIENGFYYKHHEAIMRSLTHLCDHYSVQLFASTHSWEFLRAAAEVLRPSPEKLTVLRPKYENNECTMRKTDGQLAISAIEDEVEVRA